MDQTIVMFQNRLLKMQKHIGRWAKKNHITCYRIYERDVPGFPFSIDWYEDKLYLSVFLDKKNYLEDSEERNQLLAETFSMETSQIYERIRERQKGNSQYEKLSDSQAFFEVEENELRFLVNLTDYLDTGLFLDHRITRKLVKENAEEKDVLNLFAYTGSFSVYAAAGSAKSVTTVDLSNTYLDWAEENMQRNSFIGPQFHFYKEDVLYFLKKHAPRSFDLIVLDPPTFSHSKGMKYDFDVQRDHASVVSQCLRLLRPGGMLFFATNFRKFKPDFTDVAAASCKEITKQTLTKDFTGRAPHRSFLLHAL
ncbi:MAG: class I SAM-dependent methyltransferase [Spirochaetota bacterium]